MAEKTIKTDEAVHKELERLKREYSVETFNEVLRRVLGIAPGTDVDKLAAFLDDELREAVKKVIAEIDGVAVFERGYQSDYGTDYLTFKIPESGKKVADLSFRDGAFTARYLDNKGEMKQCGRAYEADDSARYGTLGDAHESIDASDMIESVQEKVEKSYRRWSQESVAKP